MVRHKLWPCAGRSPAVRRIGRMAAPSAAAATPGTDGEGRRARPLLTVVVPVYNGGEEIVANVELIRRTVTEGLPGEEVEVIVVSDGSVDGTAERLWEARREAGIRVIHYDRNLGKGYAVKAGALAAHGDWVALVDSDLDLDPGAIPEYLAVAQREGLDLVVGSKRHPDSVVHYPTVRRLASWCYQQLNRLLFRLDVRDTQVGLKVFSRRVVEEVMPLLLVKRFAFDLELLAVAAALGYRRVRELPVRLDYRFSGSELGSRAVVRALLDTAAIFYRLRILRTYQRKRRFLRAARSSSWQPLVAVVASPEVVAALDYQRVAAVQREEVSTVPAELVALLPSGARPAGNWLTAAVPFFADPGVAAVVVPAVAPLTGSLAQRAAAAVLESRVGGGSRRSLYFPGNVRTVTDHSADAVVVRQADFLAASRAGVNGERLVSWLAERGKHTVYTPETSISIAPQPLLVPHLRGTVRHGRARGAAARRTRGASMSAATGFSLLPPTLALVGASLLAVDGTWTTTGVALLLAYAVALTLSSAHAALRFRSLGVGALHPLAVIFTQAAYVWGFACGVTRGYREAATSKPSCSNSPANRSSQSNRRA